MTASERPRRLGPATATGATITIVGGTLFVNGAPIAQAATFEVTNTNAAGAGSFQDAIDQANLNADEDTITFADGLTGTITLAATARIRYDLNINGPGNDDIVITSAAGDILYLYNGADLTITALTFDDAPVDAIQTLGAGDLALTDVSITDAGDDGVEFYASGALTITDSTISESVTGVRSAFSGAATLDGTTIVDGASRGVFVYVGGDITVTDSTIEGNDGNGLDARFSGDVDIDGSTFESNQGRGVDLYNVGEIDIAGATFAGNGGDGLEVDQASGDVSITDSTASSNSNDGVDLYRVSDISIDGLDAIVNSSDGLRIDNSGDVDIDQSSMSLNSSDGLTLYNVGTVDLTTVSAIGNDDDGIRINRTQATTLTTVTSLDNSSDGIELYDVASTVVSGSTSADNQDVGLRIQRVTGDATVDASTISGNRRQALNAYQVGGDLTLTNSTVSENVAQGTRAVIDVSSADVTVEHSTISGNVDNATPPSGGSPLVGGSRAIDLYQSDLTLDHSVVADNDGMDSVYVGTLSSVLSADYSVVTPGSGFGGSSIESDDPGLLPLADNGGPTHTMLPAIGSILVDAGDPAFTPPPATDQRGEPRVDGTVDIGAVEGSEGAAITSLAPARFVDTRPGQTTIDGMFEAEGKRAAGSEYQVQIAGRGNVPANAVGAVMNVTAVAPEGVGFVTVHPCVDPRPTASSLNYTPGVNLGNEIIAGLSATGEACFYTDQAAHLTVDVVGYIGANSPTMPLTPARLMDNRPGQSTIDGLYAGQGTRLGGTTTTMRVVNRGGVPTDAEAVIVNVTAVNPAANGFITVHPCLPTLPTAASLNYTAGVNRGNELVAAVSGDGEICLYTSADVNLTVDVVGYVPAGSNLTTTPPARFLETRDGETTVDGQNEGGGPLAADSELTLPVAGRDNVPADATAVIVNITAINPSAVGFVTVHPCVDPRPTASSLNYTTGVTGGNELVASLDTNGDLCIYTSAETNLTADIVGYLT